MTSLRMATPYLRNGIYYFRKGVPERMQPLVGKKLVMISLGTRDPVEARSSFTLVAAEVEKEWAALRANPTIVPSVPVRMDRKSLVGLAGDLYDATMKAHEADAGKSETWREKRRRLQPALRPAERDPELRPDVFIGYLGGYGGIATFLIGEEIRAFLTERGIRLTEDCRKIFALHAASALAQAYRVLEQRAMGYFEPDPLRDRFPKSVPSITWEQLFELYRSERKPKPTSVKRMRGVLSAFFEFLGHDRPGLVTEEDAIRWKQKRLKEVAVQTVRDADLAHPRALFRFAKQEKQLPTNPFADVTVVIKGGKRYTPEGEVKNTRPKEFTPEEADAILRASLVPAGGRMTVEGAAARRWLPWLCAYTGARVNEMSQARASDIFQKRSRDGRTLIWMVHITPEAGRVKDDEERDVALHPHLIEQGFLEYVKTRKGKCLFYDPKRSRGGGEAHPQYVKVGERIAAWVRSKAVGVTDTRIAPNHAWRHLVRSQLLAAKVQEQIINKIDGHKAKNVGQEYGSLWPEVCLEAISTIPAYEFH